MKMDCCLHANVPKRRTGNREFIWSDLKTLQKQLADTASYYNKDWPLESYCTITHVCHAWSLGIVL